MAKFTKEAITVEAITFDDLVQHGIEAGANIVNGMPWSFVYNDHAITHENDDCYLIPTLEGTMKFHRGDMLVTGIEGEIYPVRGDIFEKTYCNIEGDSVLDPPAIEARPSFITELERLINRHSMENGSDTPDFILATFLDGVLKQFDCAVLLRERWYGREPKQFAGAPAMQVGDKVVFDDKECTVAAAPKHGASVIYPSDNAISAAIKRVEKFPGRATGQLIAAAQKFRHYERLHREKLNDTTLTEPSRAAIQQKVDANGDMARQIEQFLEIDPQ